MKKVVELRKLERGDKFWIDGEEYEIIKSSQIKGQLTVSAFGKGGTPIQLREDKDGSILKGYGAVKKVCIQIETDA